MAAKIDCVCICGATFQASKYTRETRSPFCRSCRYKNRRTDRVCSIEGCNGKHAGLGFCENHYKKFKRKENPTVTSEQNKAYLRIWMRTNSGRYTALKRAAKDKNLGFDISREEHLILLSSSCTYCGGPLNNTGHGLDRMDSFKGYTTDNVVPCCYSCNRIKNIYLSHEEMMVAMQAILRLRNNG